MGAHLSSRASPADGTHQDNASGCRPGVRIAQVRPVSRRFQSGCVGLILGEAMAYSTSSGGVRQISPSGCASTYSFAMASGLAHGVPEADLDDLGRRWSRVRSLTKQPIRVPSAEQLGLPWSVLRSVASRIDRRYLGDDQSMVIADACQELLNHG